LILGEHGDSMVPVWSSAKYKGGPISSIPGFNQEEAQGVFEFTKKSGAEVIRLKGGAGRAVGVSIQQVVEAIAKDSGRVLPVSSLQKGVAGVEGVCLSLPTKVGRAGAVEVLEPSINDAERAGLHNSAEVLRGFLDQVQ
jgi:L-lactate dehydrogenase